MKSRIEQPTALTATLALCITLLSPPAFSSPLTPDQRARLAAVIAVYQERAEPPAISVYVDQGGKELYRADVGMGDVDDRLAVGPESIYAIGSITKSFTAHAVLNLIGAGRLRLDDTVGSVLTDYQGPAREVTVRELLNHTSGIPNYVNEIPGLQPRLRRGELQRPEMVASFASLPLSFTPGSRWSYTNSGYYLLGLIIERVSGKSYYDYLRDDVLKPLGITQVWSGDDREILPNRVRGYDVGAHGVEHATPWYYLVPYSAGSLLSTAEELAHYRRAVFTSPAMPPSVRKLITTEVALSSGEHTGYLLGALVRTDFAGLTKYAHSGEIWGFSSSNAYYPERDTTIVVLTNRKGPLLTPVSLEREIARIVLGLPAPPVAAGPLSAGTLRRYSGEYALGPMRIGPPTLSFVASDGQLYFGFGAVSDPKQMLALLPAGRDRFVLADDPETAFNFSDIDSQGPAKRVVMDALNGNIPALRTP
jgi:CubicO group peptidase (beta-lactamase class C family)